MLQDEDLVRGTAGWLLSRVGPPAYGLSVNQALEAARRTHEELDKDSSLIAQDPDVLFATVELLRSHDAEPERGIALAQRLYSEIRIRILPDDEQAWLCQQIAFIGWDFARRAGNHVSSIRWFDELRGLIESDEVAASRLDRVCRGEGDEELIDLILHSPAELLVLRDRLTHLLEATPRTAKKIAPEFHARLCEVNAEESSELVEFLSGEFALLAGAANRQTSAHRGARDWLDRAKAHFERTIASKVNLARVSYQRLAIDMSERKLESVLPQAVELERAFRSQGMVQDAIKADFLVGLCLMECGDFDSACSLFARLAKEAEGAGDHALLASAYANLVHLSGLRGDISGARELTRLALPLLEARQNWVGVAKLHWGLGNLYRELGEFSVAIAEYSTALKQLDEIGLEVDVASLHLLIAHLRFLTGADKEALESVRAALPLIERLELTPELLAVLQLLADLAQKGRLDASILRGLGRPTRS